MSELLKSFKKGSQRALGRMITWAESKNPLVTPLLEKLYPETGKAKILGITGPPGAGKSTLIALLIKEIRAKNKSVAVIAVDPTSPFTGGAILGDRIRLSEHFNDPKVYIRSLGTRGKLGGLSLATREVLHLADAFGFDYILLETVGVGQSEVDVRLVADCVAVVLVPESGDSIQTMKSGLLEIADILVVNKSDREGADRLTSALAGMLDQAGRKIPIINTLAAQPGSVKGLLDGMENYLKTEKDLVKQKKQNGIKTMIGELLQEAVAVQTRTWLEKKNFGAKNPYKVVAEFEAADPLKDLLLKWQN